MAMVLVPVCQLSILCVVEDFCYHNYIDYAAAGI